MSCALLVLCMCPHVHVCMYAHTGTCTYTHTQRQTERERQRDTKRGGNKEKRALIKLYSMISVAKCLTLINIKPSCLAVMEEEMDVQHK